MTSTDPSQADLEDRDQTDAAAAKDDAAAEKDDAEEKVQPLEMDVQIDTKSACERHVRVTIPHSEVERYFSDAFSKMMDKAAVPGFRPGRAPRKLVEVRFRKDVADQVKGSLLMDSLSQVSESHNLSPISEPDFDPTSIVLPDEGPMHFEFNIEVRPEFDVPDWKNLQIERPVRDFSDKDVDERLENLLAQHGQLVPAEGTAEPGDYLSLDIVFKDGGQEVSRLDEQTIRIRPTLSFRDGKIEGFQKLMRGVGPGEVRTTKAKISEDAPNEALRGRTIDAEFHVHEVKKLELPKLTHAFLDQLGGFENEQELRDAIKESLERRLEYSQQQEARKQILARLTVAANWDLPPALLKRQSRRELDRMILELRRSGFSEAEIRSHGNDLLQNSQRATARALKEHFILERIAEQENIEDLPEDYDTEVRLIAQQSGETPRRVRAQLEKRGLMDTLRNQIIERKVIDLILSTARFTDVPYKAEPTDSEAVDAAAGGEEPEIPEAKHAEASELGQAPQHPT